MSVGFLIGFGAGFVTTAVFFLGVLLVLGRSLEKQGRKFV